MRHIGRAQDLCDRFGIVPTYVVDYPVAAQEEGFGPLRHFAAEGRALIGAHLHPWVSPPFVEPLSSHNSYPGNLPRDVEYKKLAILTELIASTFGTRPGIYLAGRYGAGPNTPEILEALGYEVDVSPCLPMDLTADGGPDYSELSNHPYWSGPGRRVLVLPATGDFVGWWPIGKRFIYRVVAHRALAWARLPGVLSRVRALDRLRLSPEGFTTPELQRLTRSLMSEGFKVFLFSFHSPSICPGCTPYVRDERDLEIFLNRCRDYFTFFREEIGGAVMTPLQIRELLTPVTGSSSGGAATV